MCIFKGQTLSGVFEQFSFTSKLLGLKCKNDFLKDKNGFESRFFFIKLTFRWSQTGLSDLKTQKTIEFLLMVDCLRIFKNITFFKIFQDFGYSPVAPGKIVQCT